MFKNPYDNDVTTWSPQGRLYQVEYAMEAVKQGSATTGLNNRKDCAVLAALKRSASDLDAPQKKIIHIDNHVGMSIAGLTADGRNLARLMGRLQLKMQAATQRYDRRPYGVGLLIAGYDGNGAHTILMEASGIYQDCKAYAIGARSQSARTYLEENLDTFMDCDKAALIRHSLLALRECLPNDIELSTKNVSLAVVGKDLPFTTYDDDEVAQFVDLLQPNERKNRSSRLQQQQPPADAPAQAAPMETD